MSQSPANQSGGANQSEASTDQNQGAPAQPGAVIGEPQGTETSNDQNQAESGEPGPGPALSGVEVFAPVMAGGVRSFVVTGVQFSSYANSNPASTSGGSGIDDQSNLVGTLGLQRVRKGSQFSLTYEGGAFGYFGPSFTGNGGGTSSEGQFHNLIAMETLKWRHWRLQLADQFSYLPEAGFGFVGFSGLNTYGLVPGGGMVGNPFLNGAFIPNQTILTGNSRRISNAATTQVEYGRGRSTVTATAVYGTLHFLDSGFLDSNSLTVLAGYNYSLTRRDIVAITGLYSDFKFSSGLPGITSRGFQVSYGRKLARSLFLQAGGGPITSKSAVVGVGNTTRSTWSTFTSIQYLVSRGSVALIYSRSPTTGSGLLIGAESDYLSLVASRQLSRAYFASVDASYAHNTSLVNNTNANQQFKFNTWQTGVTLSRNFGERFNAYLYGNVLQQLTGGSEVFRYAVGVGLNWHARPIRLH
ncbi:MAG TPA: hypothetical protein VG206_22460 [Terriglobia bacterium]|nr:hypothetical protein [Terriglobia bacterium]